MLINSWLIVGKICKVWGTVSLQTTLYIVAEAREWDDTLDNICLRLVAYDKYTGMETSFHNIEGQTPKD